MQEYRSNLKITKYHKSSVHYSLYRQYPAFLSNRYIYKRSVLLSDKCSKEAALGLNWSKLGENGANIKVANSHRYAKAGTAKYNI